MNEQSAFTKGLRGAGDDLQTHPPFFEDFILFEDEPGRCVICKSVDHSDMFLLDAHYIEHCCEECAEAFRQKQSSIDSDAYLTRPKKEGRYHDNDCKSETRSMMRNTMRSRDYLSRMIESGDRYIDTLAARFPSVEKVSRGKGRGKSEIKSAENIRYRGTQHGYTTLSCSRCCSPPGTAQDGETDICRAQEPRSRAPRAPLMKDDLQYEGNDKFPLFP